jgi:hypothetical protein
MWLSGDVLEAIAYTIELYFAIREIHLCPLREFSLMAPYFLIEMFSILNEYIHARLTHIDNKRHGFESCIFINRSTHSSTLQNMSKHKKCMEIFLGENVFL